MTRPNPHGCPRCGRMECNVDERWDDYMRTTDRDFPAVEMQAAYKEYIDASDACESHLAVDWQAECRALSGSRQRTGDQAIDELVGNFEPEDLASMFLEAQRKHDAVRARIDEHADEIVRLRAAVAALTPDAETLAAAGEVLDKDAPDDWSTFVGPCIHGRDPFDRCAACGELSFAEARTLTLAPSLAAWVAERGSK